MSKVVRHLKQNVIAYLALFVALGGTSYAAISLPRNSVGAKQLRNHSIDPIKLDRNVFGGYVRMWARVDANGNLIASEPKASVILWYPTNSQFHGGKLHWAAPISQNCFPVTNTETLPGASYASGQLESSKKGGTEVLINLASPDPVDVAVICPQP